MCTPHTDVPLEVQIVYKTSASNAFLCFTDAPATPNHNTGADLQYRPETKTLYNSLSFITELLMVHLVNLIHNMTIRHIYEKYKLIQIITIFYFIPPYYTKQ